jgi:hypothetical protein
VYLLHCRHLLGIHLLCVTTNRVSEYKLTVGAVGTRFIDSDYSWRIPCYFQILGPIAALLMTFNMPESPRVSLVRVFVTATKLTST